MSIRNRVALSFGAILLLFGCAVAVYLWTAALRAQTMATLDRALQRQVLIASIRQEVDNLHKQVALLGQMDLGSGPSAVNPEAQALFNQKVDSVTGLLDRLHELTDASDRPAVEEIQKTYAIAGNAWKQFEGYIGVEPTWAVANAARAEPPSIRLQSELLPRFQEAERRRVDGAETQFNRIQRITYRLTLLIFFVSAIIAAMVAWQLSRHVGRGFSVLTHGTDVIGAMNLEHRIELHSRDEFGKLATSFNTMTERLLQARNELTDANLELARRAEEIRRRQERELQMAATIQQGLMQVRIPELPYARVQARNISCTEIGGDFYDVVDTPEGLAVVITDVSGKGISAAIMATMIQGMLRSDLAARLPLDQVAAAANRYFNQREVGGKYATLVILRLHTGGILEYINCGHIPPLLIRGGSVSRLPSDNVPIGLLRDIEYTAGRLELARGDRILMVTDGVTEAANAEEEFFGDERLEAAVQGESFHSVFAALDQFCAGTPFNDDCTVVELTYLGEAQSAVQERASAAIAAD